MDRADDPARLGREVVELRRGIELLHEISTLVRSAQELEPILYALLTGVTAGVGLGMNRAAIFLDQGGMLCGTAAIGPIDEEEKDRVWRSIARESPDLMTLYESGLALRERAGPFDRIVRTLRADPRGSSPVALAFRRGKVVFREGSDDLGGLFDLETIVASPLRGEDRVRGVLVADRRFDGTPANAATRMVFEMLADHAGRAVETAERFQRLAAEARTDPLTGLGTRRSFKEQLEARCAAALADGPSVGLLMMDLDDFKVLNDTYGHPAGDSVLGEVGRRLLATLRPNEAFRYGGEELVMLLPGVGGEALEGAAQRIFEAVTGEPFTLPGGPTLSIRCSVGGAVLPDRALRASELVQAADDALLRAKREGKFRVCLA